MRKIAFSVLVLCIYNISFAQLAIESGALFTISSGARVYVQGDVTSNTDIQGTGTLVLNGSGPQNLNMNGFSVANLEIDNNNNVSLHNEGARITNGLTLVNGKILTGDEDLVINMNATINGAASNRYIVTNSNGRLVSLVGVTPRTFPVGADNTSYSPVIIANTGTIDEFYVRVMQGVKSNGLTGTPITNYAIDRTWIIDESVAGGSNATVSLQWNAAQELPSFSTSGVHLYHFTGGTWNPGSAQNVSYASGIASISRSGITNFSPFAVANTMSGMLATLLNLKLYLQGYYAGAGQMQPVLANQGVGASSTATDNITVELHDAATPSIITATATGVLNSDGTATLTYPPQTSPQYITILHRNSLQTWSANPVTMSGTVNYDFSDAASKAYGNNMIQVSPGIWAIYTGDLNQDGFIDSNDYPVFDGDSFNGVQGIYIATDMNGDGFVDSNDYPVFDMNSFAGVAVMQP